MARPTHAVNSTKIALEEVGYHALTLRFLLRSLRHAAGPAILVNATPKTGTTWLVHMVESIPGYRNAGNFKGNVERYRDVQEGTVIHGHDLYTPELARLLSSRKIKVVVTIRDPRDQTVSRMFHVRRDTTHPWYERLRQMQTDEALMKVIEGGAGLPSVYESNMISKKWLDHQDDNIMCVRYEDNLADPEGEFTRVVNFLGIPLGKKLISAIVHRNRFERSVLGRRIWATGRLPGEEDQLSHFRKGIAGDWRNYFGPQHIQRIKEVAGDLFIEMGYEKSTTWE